MVDSPRSSRLSATTSAVCQTVGASDTSATAPVLLTPDGLGKPSQNPGHTATSAALALTHLPGSASRISVDFPAAQRLLSHNQSLRNAAAQTAGPGAARHSLPLAATNPAVTLPPRPSLPPLALSSTGAADPASEPLTAGRDLKELVLSSGRYNPRASVDAAAGAEILATRQASIPFADPHAGVQQLPHRDGPQGSPRCARGGSADRATQPSGAGSAAPRVSMSAPSSPRHHPDWSFGDNLQRARMQARYAAMDRADEICYVAPVAGNAGTAADGAGVGSGWVPTPKRPKSTSGSIADSGDKLRKPWALLNLFQMGSKDKSKASAKAAPPGGKANGAQGKASGGAGRKLSGGPLGSDSDEDADEYGDDDDGKDSFGDEAGFEDDDEPLPVEHSRDSRLVHRTRLGLDGRPQRLLVMLGSHDSADSQAVHDEADAAIAAAAAAFANAVSAVSVTGPCGAPGDAAAAAALLPPPRRVRFRRPPVAAVHFTSSDEFRSSDESDRASTHFTFIDRLRSQLLSLSGSVGKRAPLPGSAQLYHVKSPAQAAAPPPPPAHSKSAPLLKLSVGGGGSSGKPSPNASSTGGILAEFRRSFRMKGVVPVSAEQK